MNFTELDYDKDLPILRGQPFSLWNLPSEWVQPWVGCHPWGEISEKTTESSERLGRQARPGIEPGTSRLPVFEREAKDGQLDIHALPGIRTRNLWYSSRLP